MNDGRTASEEKSFGMGAFLIGVLVGAVVGGAAALLLSPKSGAENREFFKTQWSRLRGAGHSGNGKRETTEGTLT